MDAATAGRDSSGEQWVEQILVVHDELGLHARPAARLAKAAGQFQAEITLSRDGVTVDAKSILDILCLAATRSATLLLRCRGEDAEAAAQAIVALFQQSLIKGGD